MTSISSTISTQTTTFLAKCPSVLQRKEIRAAFIKKMVRIVSKKAVSINKTTKIHSKQAAQNKKTLLKVVREMTLNIRKERMEQSKANKIDRLAAQEIFKADKIDRMAVQEISKAEKEQAKADKEALKEAKEADKEAKEADKIIRLAVKEITKAEREAKKDLAVRAAWEELTQRMAIDAPGAVFSRRPLVVE
jgi:hypothetical protein